MDQTEVYRHNGAYAREHGELDLYRQSIRLNQACAEFIQQAIRQSYDGMYLDDACVKEVLASYGMERVEWVLAHTLQEMSYDGRFSFNNMEWAKSFDIPDMQHSRFMVNTHPAVLDGFVRLVRKAKLEPELASGTEKDGAAPGYAYYSLRRPVDIGTIPSEPKPDKIINFDFRMPVEKGAFEAWGCIYYSQPLTEKQVEDYELRAAAANPREKTSVLDDLKKKQPGRAHPAPEKQPQKQTGPER